jgi:RNA polymerase sigma factor (sigma-70 family)
MTTPVTDFIPTRQSLLSRLRDWQDQGSWKDFFDTYWKLIYGVARKAGLSDAEAQDVVQETLIAVAKKIPDFHYDPALGSFKGWLMQLTRWRIADQFRKKQYEKHGQRFPREERLQTSTLEQQPDVSTLDLEHLWDEEWRRHLTDLALQRVKGRVRPAEYQMFFLHVLKKMPAATVAARLGAKLPKVYFAKYKISALVKREIKLLERRIS